MANLSATLSDVTDVSRVVEAPGQTSGLATALGALGKGFDAVNDAFTQRAQTKRQAAADARAAKAESREDYKFTRLVAGDQAEDFAGKASYQLNAAARDGIETVQTAAVAPPVDGELAGIPASFNTFLDDSTGQMQRAQVGVSQGKLPAIALNGLANKIFASGLNQGIPAGLLAKAFKDRGIDAFHEYEVAMQSQGDAEKAAREEENAAYKEGLVALPHALDEGKTREEIVTRGREQLAANAVLDAQAKNVSMQAALNADQRATNADTREQNDNAAQNISIATFDTAIGPVLEDLLKTTNPLSAPERGSDTTYEMKQAKLIGAAPAYFAQVKAKILNDMRVKNFSPSAIASASAQIDDRIKGITDGLTSGGKAYQEAATLVGTSFGMRMREAAPLVYQMKSLGIDYASIPGLLDTMDPKVKARLGAQLKPILADGLVDSAEKTAFKNLMAVATGKANITDIDSQAGRRQIVQQSASYVTNQNGAIARGKGDPDVYMSMGRQVTIGAASLTAASSTNDLRKATEVLAGRGTIDAVNALRGKADTKEEADLLGSAKRSASARLLTAAKTKMGAVLQSGDDRYQILNFNSGSGQWEFAFNDKKWRQTHPGGTNPGYVAGAPSYAQGQQTRSRPTGPSEEARQLLATMNGNLNFLTRTGEWDGDSPKGSYREVASFWATGRPTPDMQKKTEGKKQSGSIYDIQDRVLEGFSKIPDINTEGTPAGNSRGERNNNWGNLEDSPFTRAQPGYKGSDGRFAQFETAEHGKAAQAKLLEKNYIGKGYNTVQKVIGRYAPRSDNAASFDNYVAYVAKRLNVNPSDTLSPAMTARLAEAMNEFETGKRRA